MSLQGCTGATAALLNKKCPGIGDAGTGVFKELQKA